jgi:hypothetical protein
MNTILHKGSEQAKRYFIYRYWTNQADKLAGVAFAQYIKVARVGGFRIQFGIRLWFRN